MTSENSEQKYYCDDRGGGERVVVDTLSDALETAEALIKYCRREAMNDGEWPSGSDEISVGMVSASGDEDDDIPMYQSTFVPEPAEDNDDGEGPRECFDVKMMPVTPAPEPGPKAA